MDSNLSVAIMFLSITTAITVIVIALSNHRLKMRMVKLGHLDENAIKVLTKTPDEFKLNALKWGLILLFGGLGLVVLEFIPYSFHDSPLPSGVEAIFLSLGFLAYYYVARKGK